MGDQLDAEADFGERDRAHIKPVERLRSDERDDLRLGSRPAQLGQDVGIKQPPRHSATSRTGNRTRCGAMSTSRSGEACMAAINASPLGAPVRRRNSSAETTTTSSRPCTVTCCGPSPRARRTNSLKRALASCNNHWPGCLSRAVRRGRGVMDGGVLCNLVMLTRLARSGVRFQVRAKPRAGRHSIYRRGTLGHRHPTLAPPPRPSHTAATDQ